jgi:tRNA U34 5-carboxymethylaminomethyl modifying enzyme MnmG/GidA
MTKRSWVYINGEAIEITDNYVPEPTGHFVMNDIQPYQSMIDGRMITSRSEHREHLRANGCIEVGNEKMETKVAPVKDNRREVLRSQLANMTHSQANKILSKLRDDVRFHRR